MFVLSAMIIVDSPFPTFSAFVIYRWVFGFVVVFYTLEPLYIPGYMHVDLQVFLFLGDLKVKASLSIRFPIFLRTVIFRKKSLFPLLKVFAS